MGYEAGGKPRAARLQSEPIRLMLVGDLRGRTTG
jgi:hypothetical protein